VPPSGGSKKPPEETVEMSKRFPAAVPLILDFGTARVSTRPVEGREGHLAVPVLAAAEVVHLAVPIQEAEPEGQPVRVAIWRRRRGTNRPNQNGWDSGSASMRTSIEMAPSSAVNRKTAGSRRSEVVMAFPWESPFGTIAARRFPPPGGTPLAGRLMLNFRYSLGKVSTATSN
jgi:hypothetical protein